MSTGKIIVKKHFEIRLYFSKLKKSLLELLKYKVSLQIWSKEKWYLRIWITWSLKQTRAFCKVLPVGYTHKNFLSYWYNTFFCFLNSNAHSLRILAEQKCKLHQWQRTVIPRFWSPTAWAQSQFHFTSYPFLDKLL